MGNKIFITISFMLGFMNTCLLAVVTIIPQWRVNSVVASQPNTNMLRYKEGLWLRCTAYYNAVFSCDMYDTAIIGLAAYLNAFRALMIISCILTVAAVICSLLGMKCLTALEEDSRAKRWCVIIGGFSHIASGIFTGICVSWYAAEVIWQYYYPYQGMQPIQFTLGACLYLGWISMGISLLCGCLMACCGCCNKPAVEGAYKYSYSASNTEKAVEKTPVQPPYQPEIKYKERSYSPKPYHSSHRHSHLYDRHSHHGSHRSICSHSSSRNYRDSPRIKHSRQESDVVKASEFV